MEFNLETVFAEVLSDDLLKGLETERNRFTESNPDLIKAMIDELIKRKVYPEKPNQNNPNTVYQMVSGWGPYWHQWDPNTATCKVCGGDQRDHHLGPPFIVFCQVDHNRAIAAAVHREEAPPSRDPESDSRDLAEIKHIVVGVLDKYEKHNWIAVQAIKEIVDVLGLQLCPKCSTLMTETGGCPNAHCSGQHDSV
jgi:hypothetical protein